MNPEIEKMIRDYTLAMESETYAEYMMKRDLDGSFTDKDSPGYDEDGFHDAHRLVGTDPTHVDKAIHRFLLNIHRYLPPQKKKRGEVLEIHETPEDTCMAKDGCASQRRCR